MKRLPGPAKRRRQVSAPTPNKGVRRRQLQRPACAKGASPPGGRSPLLQPPSSRCHWLPAGQTPGGAGTPEGTVPGAERRREGRLLSKWRRWVAGVEAPGRAGDSPCEKPVSAPPRWRRSWRRLARFGRGPRGCERVRRVQPGGFTPLGVSSPSHRGRGGPEGAVGGHGERSRGGESRA